MVAFGEYVNDDVASTIQSRDYKDATDLITCFNSRQDPISIEGKALPLDQKGNSQAIAIRTAQTGANGHGIAEDVAHTLDGAQGQAVQYKNIVRRYTPRECERLQGFPDDYTLIPNWTDFRSKHYDEIVQYLMQGEPHYSKEEAEMLALRPDSVRYKALGNSMAVPVLRWIGRRIQMWEDLHGS
jgi:DNA (cytosine-5)-methyltransferase 1